MHIDVSKEIKHSKPHQSFQPDPSLGILFQQRTLVLVYEYATNGPLSDWIYSNNVGQKFLRRVQRIQLAMDVATGLSYLHSFTTPPYVHQDINCSNTLLDSNFRGKITNFDLARSAQGQEGHLLLTRHIAGTRGHMAPEYMEHGLISTKLDVYAFGIFMLECITGKEIDFHIEENTNLSEMISSMMNKEIEALNDFLDQALKIIYPYKHALFTVKLIEICIKKDPAASPEMNEVLRILNASIPREISSDLHGE